ncbi:hydroxyacid dehydrogenase [Candidatus Berkelbacteria bacterium CG10_big_fil_rev_8_21_14_0_10_43_13]|uniref:Hydroxyacid dehydrogenase n=1 Tax=Candidatus Berkelbacteria bacterium CG10_big_fil_rev_8_21_14_0_10_43_13 TaxID=1974514 RepID=A0A2H0W5G1_9BACT|nr:MAG: hydroxyacid dehydrogenase [Candidatus Berkelbacteria bacterium CG10_big_fil_rev_8_21_14_0_10_43_13]
MKIAFFELEEWEKKYFQKELADQELSFVDEPLTDELDQKIDAEIVSVFIYSKVDAKTLDKLPNLKFIATRSTGYDHIDIAECKKRNIVVSNVPSYGENTVAEHTFALILALSRKIVESANQTRLGNFDLSQLRGFDLKGKTIGVVGTGKIGSHVVRMAHGFEMRPIAYDPFPNNDLIDHFSLDYVDLDDLLSKSDIITLHLPLNEKTRYLISAKNIGKIKKGAYLINTARGGLVETTALVSALQDGTLAGVGIDVLEGESDIKEEWQLLSKKFSRVQATIDMANNILLKNPKVIVTPHNAFNSKEALQRIMNTTKENIAAFLAGKTINEAK